MSANGRDYSAHDCERKRQDKNRHELKSDNVQGSRELGGSLSELDGSVEEGVHEHLVSRVVVHNPRAETVLEGLQRGIGLEDILSGALLTGANGGTSHTTSSELAKSVNTTVSQRKQKSSRMRARRTFWM